MPISDVSSDLTIEVGTSSFALHKFPLISRSGRIRKLLLEARDSKILRVSLDDVPGGAEGFELAAKFCYGVKVEILLSNVAMLHCAAHFLEMTEEFSERNLDIRTEAYLKEMVFPNISSSIHVLHCCEILLPISEQIKLVSRLVSAIACNACQEQLTLDLLELDVEMEWGNSLKVLNIDFFERVMSAMKIKGLKQDLISKLLMNYAHDSLENLQLEKKRRVMVETVVTLLPNQSQKSSVPVAFLSSMLKTAMAASASTSCLSSLEKRIGLQLDQAILDDILIRANLNGGNNNTIYDTDASFRIFSAFLNFDEIDEDEDDSRSRDDYNDTPESPKQSSLLKVSKLLDTYLAEVATDSNLVPSKFISLADLLPKHARILTDGLYKAVDIYLKVHPNTKDSELYRLCKPIDYQKLSHEACSHAAQNERLPMQMSIRVLYFEQVRLRNAMNNGYHDNQFFSRNSGSSIISSSNSYASAKRENRELKLEVAKMRMRLTELEKDHVFIKQQLVKLNSSSKLFKSFSKKISKLFSALFYDDGCKVFGAKANSEPRILFQKSMQTQFHFHDCVYKCK